MLCAARRSWRETCTLAPRSAAPNGLAQHDRLGDLPHGLPALLTLALQHEIRLFFSDLQFALQDPLRTLDDLAGLETLGEPRVLALQPRALDLRAHQVAQRGDEPALAFAVGAPCAVLHVDH